MAKIIAGTLAAAAVFAGGAWASHRSPVPTNRQLAARVAKLERQVNALRSARLPARLAAIDKGTSQLRSSIVEMSSTEHVDYEHLRAHSQAIDCLVRSWKKVLGFTGANSPAGDVALAYPASDFPTSGCGEVCDLGRGKSQPSCPAGSTSTTTSSKP